MFSLKSELESQSRYSPGVVADTEGLLRLWFSPEHINNGEVQESAISTADLLDRGFSVDRIEYCDTNIIRKRSLTQRQKKPDDRISDFIAHFKCRAVRMIFDDRGDRAFVVIDEINENERPINCAHAAIYSAERCGRATIKQLRKKLLPCINRLESAENIISEIEMKRIYSEELNKKVHSSSAYINGRNEPESK